ncbi:uncharacterized protein LOC132204312 [Neocloeon triangulifer]|uniref:uncharacterized protein LOC132204312 n=1 Tax=Neocloeon triangulifer TaxID=2078957 RepID=UPI00286FA125|nr:uncharacterized protein LOC132204312 [Neocloeon triangulifer]
MDLEEDYLDLLAYKSWKIRNNRAVPSTVLQAGYQVPPPFSKDSPDKDGQNYVLMFYVLWGDGDLVKKSLYTKLFSTMQHFFAFYLPLRTHEVHDPRRLNAENDILEKSDGKSIEEVADFLSHCHTLPRILAHLLAEVETARDFDLNMYRSKIQQINSRELPGREFLFSPWVLLQLPFEPVIFHQWLALALLETFKVHAALAPLTIVHLTKESQQLVSSVTKLAVDLALNVQHCFDHLAMSFQKNPEEKKGVSDVFKLRVPKILSALEFFSTETLKVLQEFGVLCRPSLNNLVPNECRFALEESWSNFSNMYSFRFWAHCADLRQLFESGVSGPKPPDKMDDVPPIRKDKHFKQFLMKDLFNVCYNYGLQILLPAHLVSEFVSKDFWVTLRESEAAVFLKLLFHQLIHFKTIEMRMRGLAKNDGPSVFTENLIQHAVLKMKIVMSKVTTVLLDILLCQKQAQNIQKNLSTVSIYVSPKRSPVNVKKVDDPFIKVEQDIRHKIKRAKKSSRYWLYFNIFYRLRKFGLKDQSADAKLTDNLAQTVLKMYTDEFELDDRMVHLERQMLHYIGPCLLALVKKVMETNPGMRDFLITFTSVFLDSFERQPFVLPKGYIPKSSFLQQQVLQVFYKNASQGFTRTVDFQFNSSTSFGSLLISGLKVFLKALNPASAGKPFPVYRSGLDTPSSTALKMPCKWLRVVQTTTFHAWRPS